MPYMAKVTIPKKIKEFWNWDYWIQDSQLLEGLSAFEKREVERAFLFLRKELGENFLELAFNNRHPICWYIVNRAPWARKWITWFAEALKALKNAENYSSLLERIKDPLKFNEAIAVLEFAYKFSKNDFKVVIDPSIEFFEKRKKPDLKITDQDKQDELFIEISRLIESETEKRAFETLRRITDVLWREVPFFVYSGRVYKILSKRHLEEVCRKVEELIKKVKQSRLFQELTIDNVIEIGIAPVDDVTHLEEWASDRGLKIGFFEGPSFEIDEIRRIRAKIRKEQEQLPNNYPNILIISVRNFNLLSRNIDKAISELEEEVYEYPHLLFVIIQGKQLGLGEDRSFMKGQHVYIEKTTSYHTVEKFIVLLNRFCDYKVSPSVITKVYNSLRSM